DLQRARVGERDRDLERRGIAAVAEVLDRDTLEVEPRPHAEHLGPVAHGGLDVPHHVAVLARLAEDAAHPVASFARHGARCAGGGQLADGITLHALTCGWLEASLGLFRAGEP